MIEALVDPIGDRAIGEDGRKATPASLEQVVRSAHVEKALVLACKAGCRQVLGRCRASHRDGDPVSGLMLKLTICVRNLVAEQGRVHGLIYDFASSSGFAGERPDPALVQPVEQPVKLLCDAVPR